MEEVVINVIAGSEFYAPEVALLIFSIPTIKIRLLWFALTIFTGGTLIFVYIICAFIFPSTKKIYLNDFRN